MVFIRSRLRPQNHFYRIIVCLHMYQLFPFEPRSQLTGIGKKQCVADNAPRAACKNRYGPEKYFCTLKTFLF